MDVGDETTSLGLKFRRCEKKLGDGISCGKPREHEFHPYVQTLTID